MTGAIICYEYVDGIGALVRQHQLVAAAIVVGRKQFVALGGEGMRASGKADSVAYDVKYVLAREAVDRRF